MAIDNGLYTYGDQTVAEDVTDFITNVDYESTPFFSNLGESVAENTLHEWLTDGDANPADNAQPEGYTTAYTNITPPTRKNNITQILNKDVRVSKTQMAVRHYGGDPFTYQMTKRGRELAKDINLALIQGTRASGNGSTARHLDGAIALITTNKTAQSSTPSLDETKFNDLLQMIYDNKSDVNVDCIFTGATLKRAISGFTGQNTTKYTDASTGRIYNSVSIYESDFGVHMVHLERAVPAGALLGVDSSKWKTAYLRRIEMSPQPISGSAKAAVLETELTLEALAEKSSFYASGYAV